MSLYLTDMVRRTACVYNPEEEYSMKKKWKTVLMCSLAVTSLFAFTGVPAYAAYTLNSEVTNPTDALKQAASIGVRVYENPEMASAPDKDAIVILSFGTPILIQRSSSPLRLISSSIGSRRMKALPFLHRKKHWIR